MLDRSKIENFKATLRGQLIQPEDAGYDDACKVHNGMIHKRPRMFARCADVADVITAVNFARDNNILVSIRCGGHNAGGLGICDDGLVIDLSPINWVHVDPAAQTVRAGGGTTWGDVDHAAHPFGLAVPAGIISTTGIGGLTLGGGLGYLTRNFGLTIDNLLAADVVLADGSFVTASVDKNPDLFWALRGGGGNFGVVTSFLYKAHPVTTVFGGPILYELGDATDVLKWYRNFITHAPNELNGFFAFLSVPPGPPFPEHLHNKKMCGVVWCYSGSLDKAEDAFKPVRAFKTPALDFVGPLPYPVVQSMFDALLPPGLLWYWKADFMNELSDAAVAEHVKWGSAMPTALSTMHLYPIDGAASRPKNSDSPWAYRQAKWAQIVAGIDPDPANKEKITAWSKGYFDALHPHSAGGAYVNFMMEEGEERIKATYKDNSVRLAQIKKKYDPQNLFRVNQNIKPAS
jgi:hypothetical protein